MLSSPGALIRVLQVPGDHPYVLGVTPASVVPVPVVGDAGPPHPVWAPGWLAANADRLDAVHVHFGFDHLTGPQLAAWLGELDRLGLPLVLTVHDLRNPHHDEPHRHDEHLDLLVPAAAALLTLTDAAARRIAARWGRRPAVVPHPPVVVTGAPPHRGPDALVAGIHLKGLRRNVVDPAAVVAAAASGAAAAGGVLRVDLHPDAAGRPELDAVHALAGRGAVDLRVHARFDDDDLLGYLAGLDVSVLPYRFGTHSGWLEACRDVGTRVVAPSCGLYRHQWDEVVSYPCDEVHGLDGPGLTAAVATALRLGPTAVPDDARRATRLDQVRALHAAVYREVVATAEKAA